MNVALVGPHPALRPTFFRREKDSPLLFREFDSRVPVSRIKDGKHRSSTGRLILLTARHEVCTAFRVLEVRQEESKRCNSPVQFILRII